MGDAGAFVMLTVGDAGAFSVRQILPVIMRPWGMQARCRWGTGKICRFVVKKQQS